MFRRGQSDRDFMRELLLRMERSERQHTATIQSMIASLEEHRGEWRAEREQWWKEWQADQEERRAEQRASREALFRMLDRLGPGDASA